MIYNYLLGRLDTSGHAPFDEDDSPGSHAEVRPRAEMINFDAPRRGTIVGCIRGFNYDRFANLPPSRKRLVYPESADFAGPPTPPAIAPP